MNIGDIFLLNHPDGRRGNLWVFSSNLTIDREAVAFKFVPWLEGCDESCVINPGDHASITRKSIVAYQFGQVFSERMYATALESRILKERGKISKELLKRVQAGALHSIYVPEKFQRMIRDSLII
ncbi:MAG: hypothetical protein AABZ64_14885 [Nitrospinota bacterium]